MRTGVLILGLLLSLFAIGFASAACEPKVSLINQDPYPAIPGDYVKIVFQINGIDNPDCGDVAISLMDDFPFSLDPGMSHTYSASSYFQKDYSSFMVVPYKVRINEEALDGDNPIEISLAYGTSAEKTVVRDKFNISIKDSRSNFEVFVKNYDFTTNTITFQVLNSGKNDVKAVTIKILDGVSTKLKGADVNVIGDLDSNEYTTADFLMSPLATSIPISITYTDSINARRTINQSVEFIPENFEGVNASSGMSIWMILFFVLVILVIAWFVYKTFKKKSH